MSAIEQLIRDAVVKCGKVEDLHPAPEVALAVHDAKLTLETALIELHNPEPEIVNRKS